MLQHSTQSGCHSLAERGLDLYETPPIAVEALLAVENLSHWIWEPCAGLGAIANVLRDRGHAVICSDPIRYDDFSLHFVGDFMLQTKAPVDCDAIVTNPPYQIATEFTRHALDLAPRVYLLLRLAFLESVRRTEILERRGLACVHVFRRRLPMMHRDGWNGPRASSAIPFGWFVWDRDHRGPAIINRIGSEVPCTVMPFYGEEKRQVFILTAVYSERSETGSLIHAFADYNEARPEATAQVPIVQLCVREYVKDDGNPGYAMQLDIAGWAERPETVLKVVPPPLTITAEASKAAGKPADSSKPKSSTDEKAAKPKRKVSVPGAPDMNSDIPF
jgi:hypothetical protein